jgi:threonine dehydrogenase-like Zn-dependent dehydrogenase
MKALVKERPEPGLTLAEGAVLENLGIAVHAVELEQHDPGDWAVVIGCGPIGILAAQTLKAWGVRVMLTDLSPVRLEHARALSGGLVVNIREQDPRQVIADLTHGQGADFVLEAAATPSALDQAFNWCARVAPSSPSAPLTHR